MRRLKYFVAVGMLVMTGLLAGCETTPSQDAVSADSAKQIEANGHAMNMKYELEADDAAYEDLGEKTVKEMQKTEGSKDPEYRNDIDLDANEPGADDLHKKDVDWEDVSAPLEREMESWDQGTALQM